jgi:hypothetical protein
MPVEAGVEWRGGGAPCGNPVWGTGILSFPSTSLALFLQKPTLATGRTGSRHPLSEPACPIMQITKFIRTTAGAD